MIRATIFDMDGLLVDSEPIWREAEVEVFRSLGVPLTLEMCHQTTGLRVDDVVAWWMRRHPWEGPSPAEVQERLIARMVERLGTDCRPKPGVARALEWAEGHGLRLALASSSPMRIIEAALGALGIRDRLQVVRSAEAEPYAKPHPGIFLRTAADLGVEPEACLVFEDSLTGVIAAKAARMRCVCVPEVHPPPDPRFALADCCLGSLEEVSDELLA